MARMDCSSKTRTVKLSHGSGQVAARRPQRQRRLHPARKALARRFPPPPAGLRLQASKLKETEKLLSCCYNCFRRATRPLLGPASASPPRMSKASSLRIPACTSCSLRNLRNRMNLILPDSVHRTVWKCTGCLCLCDACSTKTRRLARATLCHHCKHCALRAPARERRH